MLQQQYQFGRRHWQRRRKAHLDLPFAAMFIIVWATLYRPAPAGALAPQPSRARTLKLANNGKSRFVIVVAGDAIAAEKTAALQLQKYLKQVSGADFTIKSEAEVPLEASQILVGAGARVKSLLPAENWQSLGSDGIVIKTAGNKLVLAGGRPRGTLYAVFEFLQDTVGCRWWTPAASTIPRLTNLVVKVRDTNYIPQFAYRENYSDEVQADPVFATIARENGQGQQQSAEWGGHYNILGWVHTFSALLPQEKYFKAHPEWYSDPANGNKPCTANSKMPATQDTQLCLSNPQIVDELTAQALEWIKKNPEAGYISISQNDNYHYCQCPLCAKLALQEGSQSGPILNFVNQVAARIGRLYPDFKVETLAYQGSEAPPHTIRPAANVLIRLAPLHADFGHPLNSDWNKKTRDNLLHWAAIAPHMFAWNYVTNFTSTLMPHPNWAGLGSDLRFFADNNVVGIFEQGNAYTNGVGDFAPLRAWLISRLMWNPRLDQTELMVEFLRGYYGAAAPYLSQYIGVVQAAGLRQNGQLSCFTSEPDFLTLADMNQATRLFDKAAQVVAGDETLALRVARERLSLDAAWLIRYRTLKAAAAQNGQQFLGPADGVAALRSFVAAANSFGVKYWGESVPLEQIIPLLQARIAE